MIASYDLCIAKVNAVRYVPPPIPGLQKLLHGGLQFKDANCRLQSARQVPDRSFGETIP